VLTRIDICLACLEQELSTATESVAPIAQRAMSAKVGKGRCAFTFFDESEISPNDDVNCDCRYAVELAVLFGVGVGKKTPDL